MRSRLRFKASLFEGVLDGGEDAVFLGNDKFDSLLTDLETFIEEESTASTANVKTIADSLVKNGYVENRVKVGITGNALSASEATGYGVPQGILVKQVIEGGPCDGTGIKENDIIIGLDGEDVKSFADIYAILEKHKDGDKVKLKYYQSESGEEVEEEITLAADKG
jgi:serine protease Do